MAATKEKFVNPLDVGVTYEDFTKAIPKGMSVTEYCKDVLSVEQIEWLEIEINHYKKNA